MKLRGIICALCLAGAFVAATCKVAHAQTSPVNPRFIEFTSADHTTTQLAGYTICFYPSTTSTTAFRCNDVPKAQAVLVSGQTYRVPRASWATGLPTSTNLFPRVMSLGTNAAVSDEVAPTIAPFSFRLETPPAAVTAVSVIP